MPARRRSPAARCCWERRLEHLGAVGAYPEEAGVDIVERPRAVCTCAGWTGCRAADVMTGPFPGFPTDMQAQFMALMAWPTVRR